MHVHVIFEQNKVRNKKVMCTTLLYLFHKLIIIKNITEIYVLAVLLKTNIHMVEIVDVVL